MRGIGGMNSLSTVKSKHLNITQGLDFSIQQNQKYSRGIFMAEAASEQEKRFSKQLIGKTVVSKTGKRFGELADIIFETRSGELIHMVLENPTSYTEKLELEKDGSGRILIPFSAVIAIGDFLVVAEEDIV